MSDLTSTDVSFTPGTIDFTALHAKAMAMPEDPTISKEEKAAAAVATQPTNDEVATVTTPQPEGTETVKTESTLNVVDLADDAMVRIKVDGVEQIVSYKDYKDGIQREATFTKRMQTLAQQRREAEAEIARQAAEVQRRFEEVESAKQRLNENDPMQALAKLLAQQANPAPPQADPNEIATIGEVQQRLEELAKQQTAQQKAQSEEFLKSVQLAAAKLREEQAIQADAQKFSAALAANLSKDEYKVLNEVVPFTENAIRYQVSQLDPKSIDEAIEFSEKVMQEWVGKIQATSTELVKRQEVAKARAKMEPPTGSPAPIQTAKSQPQSFLKKDGKIDWQVLSAQAKAIIDSRV